MRSLYEKLSGTNHREGYYLIPDISLPPSPHVGICGLRRKIFLQENRKMLFTTLLLSGDLYAHPEAIDRRARKMIDRLIPEMADHEGVTELLKARDQMAWVWMMNSIRARAEEAVYAELFYR